jgi:hypothetical protein
MIEDLRRTQAAVRETLERLDPAKFEETYPLPVANRRLRTGEFMMHLAVHLAYHTGQVDFHRRIVTGDATGVGAVSPTELSSARPIEG